MKTRAFTDIINFIHKGKVIEFDPEEFSKFDPDMQLINAYMQAVEQFQLSGYFLSVQRKKERDAQNEFKAYAGRLYHSLKAEGGYQSKYRNARPTEDGIAQALWDDKTYRELSQNLSTIGELCDQLWVLQKTVEHKMAGLKEAMSGMRAARYQSNLESKYSGDQRP